MILDDAILKLRRGEKHRDNLLAQLTDILDKAPLNLDFKRNTLSSTDAVEYTVFVSHVPVIGKEVGLLLGEAIQSFRVSLDYLVWALVHEWNQKLTKEQEGSIAFPIYNSREEFQRRINEKLPNISIEQKLIFETYQPYQDSDAGIAMSYLQKLSNTDKHKIIVPVFIALLESGLKIPTEAHILNIQRDYVDGQELKNGTKICTFVLKKKLKRPSIMRLIAVPAIPRSIIEPPPPYALVTLEKVFEIIRLTCFDIISKFKFSV